MLGVGFGNKGGLGVGFGNKGVAGLLARRRERVASRGVAALNPEPQTLNPEP